MAEQLKDGKERTEIYLLTSDKVKLKIQAKKSKQSLKSYLELIIERQAAKLK